MIEEAFEKYEQNRKRNYNYIVQKYFTCEWFKKQVTVCFKEKKKNRIDLPQSKMICFVKNGSIKESLIEKNGELRTWKIAIEGELILPRENYQNEQLTTLYQTLEDETEVWLIPLESWLDRTLFDGTFIDQNYRLEMDRSVFKWFFYTKSSEKRVMSAIIDILVSTHKSSMREPLKYGLPRYVTHTFLSEVTGDSRSYVTRIIKQLIENDQLFYQNKVLIISNKEQFIKDLLK